MSTASKEMETRQEVIDGGLLVYLSSPQEAAKIAGLTVAGGKPAVSFMKNGEYQSEATDTSITQVRITSSEGERYFKKIASDSELKATAWVETDAAGNVAKDNCNVTLCYGGYTGKLPPDNGPDGQAIQNILAGNMNPQNALVPAFVEKALDNAKALGAVTEVTNYGHSMGASNAMLSNALSAKQVRNSDAVLIEPLRAKQAVPQLVREFGVSEAEVEANTVSVWATQGGKRFAMSEGMLGPGVGQQKLVETDKKSATMQTALEGHKAFNISSVEGGLSRGAPPSAAGNAPAEEDTSQSQQASRQPDLGQMIIGILQGLLSGGGFGDLFASLLQGFGPQNFQGQLADQGNSMISAGTVGIGMAGAGNGRGRI